MARAAFGGIGGAAVGLVLGFVLGGVGPRRELAGLEAENSRLQDELVEAQARAGRRSPLSMMGLDRVQAAPQETREPVAPEPGEASSGAELSVAGDEANATGTEAGTPEMAPELDAAIEAQRIRREQSRAALIEQAELDEDAVARLDAAVAEMNTRLTAMGDDLVELALAGAEPDSQDMLRLTHEASGILYDAQVEVDELIGEEGLDQVDPSAREVWNHIDLEGFRDLLDEAERSEGGDR